MNADFSGFLNIYKPRGITSHDVVSILRKITKIKQIGHTGTLDPFAQGVLPIAIGKSTRLIEFLSDDKEYIAEITFGRATGTYDCEGETIFTSQRDKVGEEEILSALNCFKGEIEQLPPIYSAIKVKGKKLYEYARKGEEVKIEPRKVFIKKIELISFDYENQIAKVLIDCSKGTYIRSIAHDLGQNLGCGAFLSGLERVKAGNFNLASAIKLEEIESPQDIQNAILDARTLLNFSQIRINEADFKKVCNGSKILNMDAKNINSDFVILIYNDKVVAIGEVENEFIKMKKVLV